jgi:hypothetical protein
VQGSRLRSTQPALTHPPSPSPTLQSCLAALGAAQRSTATRCAQAQQAQQHGTSPLCLPWPLRTCPSIEKCACLSGSSHALKADL